MVRWHKSPAVLNQAQAWCERCFQGNGSVFTSSRLWTAANLEALRDQYHNNFSAGTGAKFFPRLRLQLATARPESQRLAAEVLWILYLSVSSRGMAGATKRQQMAELWSLSGEPLPSGSPAFGAVLDEGVANPNPGFQVHSWMEFVFCVSMTASWKRLPTTKRSRLLADPWFFAEWLDAQPEAEQRQFRHMLLYLLFPETFERIVALDPKRRAVRTFLPRFGMDPRPALRGRVLDLDRALARIRPLMEDHYRGPIVDYYMPPVKNDWDARPDGSSGQAGARPAYGTVEISTAAYETWNLLCRLALAGDHSSVGRIVRTLDVDRVLLNAALQEIITFCRRAELPPLIILVKDFETMMLGFSTLSPTALTEASQEVFDYPWLAYGNPFDFVTRGAGHDELVSRLVIEPESAGEVFAIVRHRGRAQQLFRDAVFRAYGGRCAFSGSSIRAGLEAAHVVPWGYATPAQRVDVRNGLLLTAWLHRLFDAGILHLDEDMRIRVEPAALSATSKSDRQYLKKLDGSPIHLPVEPKHYPDLSCIRSRIGGFGTV